MEVTLADTAALLAWIEAGGQPSYLFFWGHTAASGLVVDKSCLSQWYLAPFEADGALYRSAEHYMMAHKALLFGDQAAYRAMLTAATPAQVKALGRQVRGFDEALWQTARVDIVLAANLAKFSQHPRLARFLLSSAGQVLVEASPVDPVWGVGLAATDPAIMSPARWIGLNLLGFALMRVRARLAETAP
ncbi:MAG: NADAR family protein [Pseudomonadota bacterium]